MGQLFPVLSVGPTHVPGWWPRALEGGDGSSRPVGLLPLGGVRIEKGLGIRVDKNKNKK